MSKYYMPATNVDPECPTEEGSILIDRRDSLQEALKHLNDAEEILANTADVDIHFYNMLTEVMEYVQTEREKVSDELLKP